MTTTNSIRSVNFLVDSNESKEHSKPIENFCGHKKRTDFLFVCSLAERKSSTKRYQWSTFNKFYAAIKWRVIKTFFESFTIETWLNLFHKLNTRFNYLQSFVMLKRKTLLLSFTTILERCCWGFSAKKKNPYFSSNSYRAETQTDNFRYGDEERNDENCHCIERNQV